MLQLEQTYSKNEQNQGLLAHFGTFSKLKSCDPYLSAKNPGNLVIVITFGIKEQIFSSLIFNLRLGKKNSAG